MDGGEEGRIRLAGAEAIAAAAALIRAGKTVAFPTETVYGLGGDATSDRALARVFAVKARPWFNPLIVHFTGADAARAEVRFDARAEALAAAFWPGPLTLVLARREASRISRLASAGLDTLAVRAPNHAVAQALLAAAAVPIAAPSANRFGDISPTTAAHVAASLGGAVDLILDGGPCPLGIESTVIDLAGAEAALLRPGGIAADAIEAVIGPLARPDEERGEAPRRSPGRIARHYAPAKPLRIAIDSVKPGEALLAFGPVLPPGAEGAAEVRNLSPAGDVVEAAANLFAMLHELDAAPCSAIAVMAVPEEGLGVAINDRLRRAAAPLPENGTGD